MVKRSGLSALITGIMMMFFVNAQAQEKVVTLASLDWEPYIGSKIQNNGYCAQIAVEAFKRGGYTVKIAYLPWERAVKESETGNYDGLFPEYFDQSRKEKFVYSDSFPGGPVGLMKRKDKAISFKKLQDLKPYTIGVVRGYINTAEFDAASYLKKTQSEGDDVNIKNLYNKQLDLIFIDQYVAQYIIKTQYPAYASELEFMKPALEKKDLYIAFSKKGKDSEAKRKAFNAGLKAMKADGTLQRIISGGVR